MTTIGRKVPGTSGAHGTSDRVRDRRRSRLLMPTAAVVGVLVAVGIVMIVSASSVESVGSGDGSPWRFARQQSVMTGFGLVGGLIAFFTPIHVWRRYSAHLYFASLIPLALVLVAGSSVNGSTRWIYVGPIGLQPSEFVKLTLIVFTARMLAGRTRRLDDGREILAPVLLHLGVVVGLIMLQPNLGTSLVIVLSILAMIFVSGVGARLLGGLAAVGALAAGVAVALTPFRLSRFSAFMDLRENLDGAGYQQGQSMVGLANGGIIGRGIGNSTIKWGYLPYPYNDYIFAVIGEELGLVGCLIVVIAFLALVCLGASIARSASDRFSMLVACGVTAWLGGQAFLNMAVVTNVLPATGVPLPFISAGGSAQIANLVAVGLLLNIARGNRHVDPEPEPETIDPEVEAVYRRFEVIDG